MLAKALAIDSRRAFRRLSREPLRWTGTLAFGLLALVPSAGCRRPPADPAAAPDVVAVVAGHPISLADCVRELGRPEGSALERAELSAVVDRLVAREAAYQQAVASQFDRRADVEATVRRVVADRYLESQRALATTDEAVSDEAVRANYESHPERYSVPARRSGALLRVGLEPKTDPAKRAERAAHARELWTALSSPGAGESAFAEAVARESDDRATRYRKGETGWISADARESGFPAEVVAALYSVADPGAFAPVVETDWGYYLVKLAAVRPASRRPLAEVADAIRQKLRGERAEAAEKGLRESARQGLEIRVDAARIASLSLAPARLPVASTAASVSPNPLQAPQ